jgi:hypothetical protein
VQDQVVHECWRMLSEWEQLSEELASENPTKLIPANELGALSLANRQKTTDSESQAAAERLCDSLQEGWRPVLMRATAPSIAHVPWLDHVDELASNLGAPRPVADATSTGEPTGATGNCHGHSAAEVSALASIHLSWGVHIACIENLPCWKSLRLRGGYCFLLVIAFEDNLGHL